ncbi:MAG TPA: response regulator [Flavisolibacter sp.]|jgi:CheY-like chemotaxis protein|nr:response regulator [Flavisolibacter sp.]
MTQSLPPKSLVLYADDDPEDIELVVEAFQSYAQNVELMTFADGIELLNFIEAVDPLHVAPCLFIIDINMPRLNGKETLRRLRRIETFAEVPAVLFSTSSLPADAVFAKNFNAGFVTKPLHTSQVHLIIDEIIEHCSDEVKKMIKKRNGN